MRIGRAHVVEMSEATLYAAFTYGSLDGSEPVQWVVTLRGLARGDVTPPFAPPFGAPSFQRQGRWVWKAIARVKSYTITDALRCTYVCFGRPLIALRLNIADFFTAGNVSRYISRKERHYRQQELT